ncbi:MAG: hypothetical protein JXR31_10390 [Prolixibacteraceae bacterium]|nr:hypothetical protein [Prolixibacteraceae bacterium]
MDLIIDDKESDKLFFEILNRIKVFKNGDIAQSLKQKGLEYKMIWGASVLDLKEIAGNYEKNHLLALKLWNKNWRETMILATLLDKPEDVTEQQMDFWTKSFANTEIAEHAVANLWVKTPFAFVKALEWCRGKKHLVRFTGLQLMGRLAMVEKNAIDEMFEPFFEVLEPLSKDPKLNTVFYRSVNLVGSRSEKLNRQAVDFAGKLKETGSEHAIGLAETIFEELTSEYVQGKFKNR